MPERKVTVRPIPLPTTVPAGLRFDWGGRAARFASTGIRADMGSIGAYQGRVCAGTIPEMAGTVLAGQIDWDHWRELTADERAADRKAGALHEQIRARVAKMSEA